MRHLFIGFCLVVCASCAPHRGIEFPNGSKIRDDADIFGNSNLTVSESEPEKVGPVSGPAPSPAQIMYGPFYGMGYNAPPATPPQAPKPRPATSVQPPAPASSVLVPF